LRPGGRGTKLGASAAGCRRKRKQADGEGRNLVRLKTYFPRSGRGDKRSKRRRWVES